MTRSGLLVAALAIVFSTPCAWGYRPFDSTDADVAGAGEFELELGPVGYLREADERSIIEPAVVANFGLAGEREFVVEANRRRLLGGPADEPRSRIEDAGLFIKQMLRAGSLQQQQGPSVATEFGLLLPGVHGESGTGASIAGILSQRWPDATLHANLGIALTREHRTAGTAGVILEGPYRWRLRPAVELFSVHESGSAENSALIGAIWRQSDALSLDAGWRTGRAQGEHVSEFRLGLTWRFDYVRRGRG